MLFENQNPKTPFAKITKLSDILNRSKLNLITNISLRGIFKNKLSKHRHKNMKENLVHILEESNTFSENSEQISKSNNFPFLSLSNREKVEIL